MIMSDVSKTCAEVNIGVTLMVLMITSVQVLETSVSLRNSPFQDYTRLGGDRQSHYHMTPGFKSLLK